MFFSHRHLIHSPIGMKHSLRTRRRLPVLVLLLSMLFSLCACGGKADVQDSAHASIPSDIAVMAEVARRAEVDMSAFADRDAALPTALTSTSAQSAVLIRADTGDILFRQNESAKLPMASTTKIMTALVAVETLPLDTPVCVTAESVGVEGSSIYLTEGEVLTLEELLYALLLESANDAAAAIAVACAGSIQDFSALMNQKASELGLTSTHFVNPHGLDHEEHYTTAYELSLIAKAALAHESLRTIMSTQKATVSHHGEDGVRLLVNHNKLLRSYEGAIGVKTGFTKKSGRCLVSAAERDGLTLIAVTLHAPDDWKDHTAMLDYGFSLFEWVELCRAGEYEQPLWVVGGMQEYVMIKNREGLSLPLHKAYGDISCVVELPLFAYAHIAQGDELGQLVYYAKRPDGTRQELGRVSLYAQYDVVRVTYKTSLWEKVTSFFKH